MIRSFFLFSILFMTASLACDETGISHTEKELLYDIAETQRAIKWQLETDAFIRALESD